MDYRAAGQWNRGVVSSGVEGCRLAEGAGKWNRGVLAGLRVQQWNHWPQSYLLLVSRTVVVPL